MLGLVIFASPFFIEAFFFKSDSQFSQLIFKFYVTFLRLSQLNLQLFYEFCVAFALSLES